MKRRFEKLFSREEANQLVPRLEEIVRRLQLLGHQLREGLKDLCQAEPEVRDDGMDLDKVIEEHPQLRALAEEMAELATQVEEYGCFLKDIDLGLVDFPSELDNEVVFLCWQFGESQLSAWHSVDEGFASRRPLSGVPKVYLN
ncbi:MAG: DUF2203 domain-containing protein [Candidatus Binataceae bacterium]